MKHTTQTPSVLDIILQHDITTKELSIAHIATPPDLLLQAEDLSKYVHVTPGSKPSSPRILATYYLPPDGQRVLEDRHGWSLIQWRKDTTIPCNLLLALSASKPNGIICKLGVPIGNDMFYEAGNELKVVSTMSVGYDHIDLKAAKKRNIQVGYTPDALTDASADMTVTLVLATARRLNEAIDAVREGRPGTWEQSWILGTHIGGKTVGILGMGRIGLATAKRLRAFNVGRILYHGNSPRPEADEVNGEFVSLDTLLKESDILCVCCSLNNTTRNILGYNEFCAMKSSSILVNTARGGVIDQDGLVRALKEDQICGAGLDVAIPEPLPANHELLSLKNCIVVPHIASATHETRNTMAVTAVENLCAGLMAKPLPYSL
ncbi:glyoxylate reductase [Syncephalis fuscata]|nr:glyoxylate reductase [Syncephalis fuscata]